MNLQTIAKKWKLYPIFEKGVNYNLLALKNRKIEHFISKRDELYWFISLCNMDALFPLRNENTEFLIRHASHEPQW